MSGPDARRQATLEKLIGGASLTEAEARAIYAQGEEAVVWALLQLFTQARGKQLPSPSTPSGMLPAYAKPPKGKRKKKPGRKRGHPGARRGAPEHIDRHVTHPLETCPHCGTKLGEPCAHRTRIIEDIAENIPPVAEEHTIPRAWCPTCGKLVEPPVTQALSGATVGNRLLTLTAWMHYGLGTTIAQIIAVLNAHLHFQLSKGALVAMWHRLAAILEEWYQAIGEEARQSAVLHADETGWREDGHPAWLWCFTAPRVTWYMIDRCRGAPALQRFFLKEFAGVLVTDFWAPYNRLMVAARQVCLVHLLRDLETVEQYKDHSGDWPAFAKKLRRLVGDAMRLKKDDVIGPESFASRKQRLFLRLDELIAGDWSNLQACRLVKRLRRHHDHLFTFLDHPEVPPDNNRAEREIRPAVIMRKNSYANRSAKGATTQAALMSVYRTLKLRGHDPLATITEALAAYIQTGKLPLLPQ